MMKRTAVIMVMVVSATHAVSGCGSDQGAAPTTVQQNETVSDSADRMANPELNEKALDADQWLSPGVSYAYKVGSGRYTYTIGNVQKTGNMVCFDDIWRIVTSSHGVDDSQGADAALNSFQAEAAQAGSGVKSVTVVRGGRFGDNLPIFQPIQEAGPIDLAAMTITGRKCVTPGADAEAVVINPAALPEAIDRNVLGWKIDF